MADYHPDEKLIKRPSDDTPLTEEQAEEWLKCANDKYYFFENYVYVQTPSGRRLFSPRSYQKRLLDATDEHRHVICLSGRQSGKSASLANDILHELIFKEDWQVLIATYSNSQALDFMDRISYAYQSLPWWLKPPAVVFNKFSIKFDNGSSVLGQTFSERTGRGKSLGRIVLDELAFGDTKLISSMMKSLLGSISADGENSKTKLNIISTPNGTANEFSYIWHSAIQGDSIFYPVKVEYDEIPGRTKKFEEEMLKTMSRDAFDQEFRCFFISSSGTLINSRFLEALPHKKPTREHGDLRLFVDSLKNRKIAISLDPAEGVGEDSSCIQLFDFIAFEQVGEYKNNMVNQTQLAVHLREIVKMLYSEGVDEVMFSYEANGIGAGIGVLLESLTDDKDFSQVQIINDRTREAKGKSGMMTTNKTKLEACGKFKDLVENGKLTLYSQRLINELKTFVKKGASFEAEPGNHDDLVSGCLLFVRMLDELRNYEESVDDVVSSVSLDSSEDEVYDIYF